MNTEKLKITTTKIIQNSALNMNIMKSEKYGLSPEETERRSLASERFRTIKRYLTSIKRGHLSNIQPIDSVKYYWSKATKNKTQQKNYKKISKN